MAIEEFKRDVTVFNDRDGDEVLETEVSLDDGVVQGAQIVLRLRQGVVAGVGEHTSDEFPHGFTLGQAKRLRKVLTAAIRHLEDAEDE